MISSIDNGFRPGADKHSIKAQNKDTDYKIYSFSSRTEMIDFAHRFSNFIKTNYPEIRQVKNISTEHINAYLQSKTKVTQKTIQHEVACINKLQLCCNKKFGISVDWKTGRNVPKVAIQQRRDLVFTDEQVQKLKEYFSTKRDCHSKTAFSLGERFALRASEICKLQVRDIKWGENVLHIHDSKGKRSRDITITDDDKKFLREITYGKSNKDRIIPLQADSICAYLSRACKTLGFNDIVKAKTSYHCLRKYSISKYYNEQIKVDNNIKNASAKSMDRLGHSRNRTDLRAVYLKI